MIGGVRIILLEGEEGGIQVDPLVIYRVVRTGPNSVVIYIQGATWTRLKIYYPDINGTLIFDSDDVDDLALIQNTVDGNTEISIADLDIRLGVEPPRGPFEAESTDQVLTTQSEPTAFTIPRFGVASAPRMRNRLRVR